MSDAPARVEGLLPRGRVPGVDGVWRVALAIARAFDPAWPGAPALALVSEDVDWQTGVSRTYRDGSGPKCVFAWHRTATDPHLAGGPDAERMGAAVHGLDAGRAAVELVPARRDFEQDLLVLDLAALEASRRAAARAAVEAFLGLPLVAPRAG